MGGTTAQNISSSVKGILCTTLLDVVCANRLGAKIDDKMKSLATLNKVAGILACGAVFSSVS